jgi:hypothetical protein
MARPLYLCEVLEQEHAALYGEVLPATWEVLETHVRKPQRVAERCHTAFKGLAFSSEKPALARELTELVMHKDVLSTAYKELEKRLSADLRNTIANNAREPLEIPLLNRLIIDEIAGEESLTPGPRARLEKYFKAVHLRQDTSALCLSGGGIRSATFALGVLQALASRNVLDKFDYISTVSGGGYIGSWLSSWIRRHPLGVRGVAAELAARPEDPLEPQPPPVAHLREYSNYLTPRLGVWSGDTWAVVGTYIRNLLLNWTVLIPLMLLLVLLPRITAALYFKAPLSDLSTNAAGLPVIGTVLRWIAGIGSGAWIVRPLRADSAVAQFVINAQVLQMTGYAMLATLLLGVAICYLGFNRPANNRYEGRKSPSDTAFIWRCAAPLTGAALVFSAAWIRYTERIEWARTNMKAADFASVRNTATSMGKIGMTIMILIPIGIWIVNVINYYRADAAARRENVAAEVRAGKVRRTLRKLLYEGMAALIAGYVSYLLLLFLTKSVFPHPVRGLGLLAFPTPVLPLLETAPVAALYVCFGVPLILLTLFISASIFVGLSSEVNEDYDREWWARCGGWVLAIIVAWPVVSATVIFGPVLIWFAPKFIAAAGGTTAVVTIILGRSSKTGQRRPEERSRYADIAARAFAPAVILLIFSALSLATSEVLWNSGNYDPLPLEAYRGAETVRWHLTGDTRRINGVPTMIPSGDFAAFDRDRANAWHHIQVFYNTNIATLLGASLACAAVALFGAGFIGVNKFSMHAMYRNRLIRAYLGASRSTRDPNPFTGFDQHDNLSLQVLRFELLWITSFSDFQVFYNDLCHSNDTWVRNLRVAVEERRRGILAASADDDGVREALFQVLNCVLEEEDFSRFDEPRPDREPTLTMRIAAAINRTRSRIAGRKVLTTRCPNLLRKNRILLDQHFPASIHPFNAPMLEPRDIADPEWFHSLLANEDIGKRLSVLINRRLVIKNTDSSLDRLCSTLNVLNGLLTSISFAELLKVKVEDIQKFDLDTARSQLPVELVCSNREILEREFYGAIYPLHSTRPMHVINAALNLVSGNNLAWQERKAETFTFSPLHSGSYRLGYRPTVDYGGQTGVTLGTAMTISGAAASPNMGYNTSAPLALLMTLFNVRLGWWLGNPGAPGKWTFHRDSPRNALRPLIAEATGKTNDTYPYVYLSDGGHFENLGLYEMVLRRRRYIVVSDAGCDPKFEFEDLGNAIRKIRTDLGVPIEMDEPMFIGPSDIGEKGKYCATGRIRYSCVDADGIDGYLLYVKPAVYSQEPKDIYTYFRTRKEFPHEPTADQFFTESQFESYRMLGRHAIDQIVAGAMPKPGAKPRGPAVITTDDTAIQTRLEQATVEGWKARSIRELFRLASCFYLNQHDGKPAEDPPPPASPRTAEQPQPTA